MKNVPSCFLVIRIFFREKSIVKVEMHVNLLQEYVDPNVCIGKKAQKYIENSCPF